MLVNGTRYSAPISFAIIPIEARATALRPNDLVLSFTCVVWQYTKNKYGEYCESNNQILLLNMIYLRYEKRLRVRNKTASHHVQAHFIFRKKYIIAKLFHSPQCEFNWKTRNEFSFRVLYGSGGGTWTSRPSGYEPDELPNCSTPHQVCLLYYGQFVLSTVLHSPLYCNLSYCDVFAVIL